MARTSNANDETIGLWSGLEAEQLELEAYVSARLGLADAEPSEPDWVRDSLAASWPMVLPEAESAVC